MTEKTLSIIKPDGVKKNIIGEIIGRFEKNGLKIKALKMAFLSYKEAQGFYAVHKEKPFYEELVNFISSAPVVLIVLEGEGAIAKNREIMGHTDPAKADEGTIRRDFATNIGQNTVHGSDSTETAKAEIAYFFSDIELVN